MNIKKPLLDKLNIERLYKKQTGGRGKFADIVFTMEPGEEGKPGLEFINLIKGVIFQKNIYHLLKKDLKML